MATVAMDSLGDQLEPHVFVTYLGQNPQGLYLADAYGCSGRRVPVRSQQSEPFTLNGLQPAPNARRAAFFSDYESPGGASLVYVADIDDEGNPGGQRASVDQGAPGSRKS